MTSPRSIRLDEGAARRLASYAAAHPGVSQAAAAARFVDEGLRMAEHSSVLFRDGPTGRRATLVAGPDVWEVVRALRSARGAAPSLGEQALLDLLADNTGVSPRLLRAAIDYWSAFPEEIDAAVEQAQVLEQAALTAERRRRDLLSAS